MATKEKTKKTKAAVTLADVKKGDSVYLYLFSGAQVGRDSNEYKVASCNEKTITLETGRGTRKFSRKTGIQTDAENPRYANFILAEPDDDAKATAREAIKAAANSGKPTKADEKTADKKAKSSKGKKAKDADEEEYEDADSGDDDEDDEPKKKSSKKASNKSGGKDTKKAKKPPQEDEDDLDDDEDDED